MTSRDLYNYFNYLNNEYHTGRLRFDPDFIDIKVSDTPFDLTAVSSISNIPITHKIILHCDPMDNINNLPVNISKLSKIFNDINDINVIGNDIYNEEEIEVDYHHVIRRVAAVKFVNGLPYGRESFIWIILQ